MHFLKALLFMQKLLSWGNMIYYVSCVDLSRIAKIISLSSQVENFKVHFVALWYRNKMNKKKIWPFSLDPQNPH